VLGGLMKRIHGPIYEHRLGVLVRELLPALRAGDRVLDVGCGGGALGAAILSAPGRPAGLVVEGLERVPRGGEPIVVHAYAGGVMPMADESYDVVILADVLHHERAPASLLRECARVSRRLLVIKDHKVEGFWSWCRVSLMDWAANAPHGVPCLYRYNSLAQWHAVPGAVGGELEREWTGLDLYPGWWNVAFGRSLQYMAVIRTKSGGGR
jgi:SAM-dependent methyltransferase